MKSNMAQAQAMMAQMKKTTAMMRKIMNKQSVKDMKNTMAQMHSQNSVNFTGFAQYLQAVGGVFNAMAQYESQMNQIFSGQTKQ